MSKETQIFQIIVKKKIKKQRNKQKQIKVTNKETNSRKKKRKRKKNRTRKEKQKIKRQKLIKSKDTKQCQQKIHSVCICCMKTHKRAVTWNHPICYRFVTQLYYRD